MDSYDTIGLSIRDETQYLIAIIGSSALFLVSLIFAAMLLLYLANNDYKIITETIAAILMVLIAFGCFMGLAILYTSTLNQVAYYELRHVALQVIAVYLTLLTIMGLWVLIQSMTEASHWELFKLVAIPYAIEYVLYLVVVFAFYNMYSGASYNVGPETFASNFVQIKP